MNFEWFTSQTRLQITTKLPIAGYIILAVYIALTAAALINDLQTLSRLKTRQWLLLAGLLIAAPALSLMLVLFLKGEFIPLLGLLPVVAAALWLGPGAGALVGGLTGLTWAFFSTGRLLQPFEVAITAAVIGYLLRQPYRGVIGTWLRQPLVSAALSAVLFGWPLMLLGEIATDPDPALVSLDRMLAALDISLAKYLIMGAAAGGMIQIFLQLRPDRHPVKAETLQTPPWGQNLERRMLYAFGPLAALMITLLVGLAAVTSYRVATRLVVEQMARDAQNVSSGIPFFVQLGRSLIANLAQDEAANPSETGQLETQLADGLRAVPFFEQLLYIDTGKAVVAAYPPDTGLAASLTPEESSRIDFALLDGAPAEVVFFRQDTQPGLAMSFVAPVEHTQAGYTDGVLLGRTTLGTNAIIEPVIDVLREGIAGSGKGLIIDSRNTILLYPAKPEAQQQTFDLREARSLPFLPDGEIYRQRLEDGTRRLVYILPVEGQSDWSVVVLVPNTVAIALAAQIALPMLILLLVLTFIAFPVAGSVLRRITTPLEQLSEAVELITAGQLGQPLDVTGEDEIGRLGHAFEEMRLSLEGRLSEQERLLRVTRNVASSLELFRVMPPILSSALDAGRAAGARVVLRTGSEAQFQTYASGETAAAMAPLDQQMLELVERQGTVVVSQIERAKATLDIDLLPGSVKSLIAFPLRSDTSFYGALWICYEHEHAFEQSELTFLSTLAGQTAVAVANARLLTEAEEGRRQLEAVLQSTADAMVVTDSKGRLVLMNPAAERYFNLRSDQVRGRKATDVILIPELAGLLTNLQAPVSLLELPDQRGKTLLANTSTIVSHNGTIAGRVAVLRDITALKELDNLKTVFLRMVSHDLRTPLTYMKGFLSMVPLAGDLNTKQMEALSKVDGGVDHISEITERLFYLSRLQFGDEVDLELGLVDIKDLLEEVRHHHEAMIQEKNAALEIEVEESVPLILVDGVLYRQAIMNLVNNALKYVPEEEGKVIARAYGDGDNQLTVAITDNGPGIRSEDQGRLFEAFYRVPHRAGDPKPPRGSGLGLALVKAIAQTHGGKVWVESEFGKGSTFFIKVPIRDHTDAG